jgi:hypothetical protein
LRATLAGSWGVALGDELFGQQASVVERIVAGVVVS